MLIVNINIIVGGITMSKAIFKGAYYQRKRGVQAPNWRNRNSGIILKNEPRIIRKKGRNFVVANPNANVLGQEITGKHYFNSDPKNKSGARIIYKKRVRSAKERAAMFSKIKGRR